MSDLLKKLKSLGLKIEKAVEIEPSINEELVPIEDVVDGEWVDIQDGKVFVVEKQFPYGYIHGNISIEKTNLNASMPDFMEIQADISPEDFLFIDTETSSLSSGAGSFVFLVGLAFFDESGLKVIQVFLDQPHHEIGFLNYLDNIIQKYNTFISYNGKSFDIPMLRSRFILNKLPQSLHTFNHFDLLHTARRIWKLRLESRRLADIETEILNFQRTDEEIPGWLVPQMYFDYQDSGDASPLKGVFYHNEMDVVSLAAIYLHINQMLSKENMSDNLDARDIYSIGSTLSKLGHLEISEDFFQAGLDKGLPDEVKNEAIRNFAYTLKRQEKWSVALSYWEIAANRDDYRSCVELAKYYEHRERDFALALKWTKRAHRILKKEKLPENQLNDILHRKSRIERKRDKAKESLKRK